MSEPIQERYELQGGQLSLLTKVQADALTEETKIEQEYAQGIYSGVQLKNSDPVIYELVCILLADGSMSQRQIAARTGTSRNLVSGINRQSPDIEPLKKQMASRARNLGQLCLERAEEIVTDPTSKVGLRDLAILAGVAIDKSQLLSGEATQRVETIDAASGADDFEAAFEALQQADAVELPAMGLEPGEPADKRAADAAPGSEVKAAAEVVEVADLASETSEGGCK